MEQIAWGAKVSPVFLDRVKWIVEDLEIGMSVADGMSKCMTCFAWESGRTFSASVKNKAGSGAIGLIQFMPTTAKQLGTTTAALAAMTAEDQLNYVWKYFAPYKGKLKTLSDLYMSILWPKGIGQPETYVLWEKGKMPTTYRQNAGFDTDHSGSIIKAEASAKLNDMLVAGMKPENAKAYDAPSATLPVKAVRPLTQVERFAVDTVESAVSDEIAPVADAVTEAAKTVTTTADTITTVAVEPRDTVTAIKHAASGWQGNLVGIVAVAGAIMADPSFSVALGRFTATLAGGTGRFGAIAALIGAALIAYRSRAAPH